MFQIGAANNSLFFWVLLSKTRHEKICQILLSNSRPTNNINLYHHLMTESELQKRCQKIFWGAFFPTDPHAHPELRPISPKIKRRSETPKSCIVVLRCCIVYEWRRNGVVKHTPREYSLAWSESSPILITSSQSGTRSDILTLLR